LPRVTPPVGRVPTTTPRPYGTSDARSGTPPLVLGYFKSRGWTSNRLTTSLSPLAMHSKSFTGSSAALIDVSGGPRTPGRDLLLGLIEACNRPDALSVERESTTTPAYVRVDNVALRSVRYGEPGVAPLSGP
jgi:hypothetical protein